MFDLDFLHELRSDEIREVADYLPGHGSRVLDLGAGSGHQSRELARLGYEVAAIDTSTSNYRHLQVHRVDQYDGVTIPFGDESFDVVFSSNVLEHIADLPHILDETRRVLINDGCAVHVLPTCSWRFWTTVSAFADAPLNAWTRAADTEVAAPSRALNAIKMLVAPFVQGRHGERGNILTEGMHFRASAWRELFADAGWHVADDRPLGLFYTGNAVFGPRASLSRRRRWATYLGSACHVYVLTKRP